MWNNLPIAIPAPIFGDRSPVPAGGVCRSWGEFREELFLTIKLFLPAPVKVASQEAANCFDK
jgi:hypothetical protein